MATRHGLTTGQCTQAVDEGFVVDQIPQLFRATASQCVLDRERAAQAIHILGGVPALDTLPAGIFVPVLLDCGDFLFFRAHLHADSLDDNTWQQAKLLYIGLLVNHKQPELAETFFNSVTTKILHRKYFHNDFIFVRPAISTELIESNPPTWRSYYPNNTGLRTAVKRIFLDFGWQRPFTDLDRDVDCIMPARAAVQ